LFQSQIKLKDMGDGELSPIGPNRKSYLLEKNKPKKQQPTKITE
jgi:hypothetical protein